MMFGLRAAVLAVASTLFFTPAVQAASLESVLAGQTNVTTFLGLVKVSKQS